MPKILLLKGLPASGKTTFAKDLCLNKQWKRVNKDDLRSMIDAGKWTGNNESLIVEARDRLVEMYLKSGYNVVVDDTNLHEKHLGRMEEIASRHSSTVEVKEFDTPLHICLDRDKNRPNPVGADTIIKMWREWIGVEKPQYDRKKKDCYIFDIDGTLADNSGRNPHDYSRVIEDKPVNDIRNVCFQLHKKSDIIICSGRPMTCMEDTSDRLYQCGIIANKLYMRGAEDKRKDREVKLDFAKEIMKEYNIIGVFDDRDQVVAMRRGLGLTCFQVGYGNF